MRRNQKAQTATEYLAVIAVLAIALAVGWGFITGEFQGGVKNLTQSVDIATKDIIQQGPSGPQLPFCNCDDDFNNWACGVEPTVPIPATINCNPRQRYKRKLCTGELCPDPQIEWCEWDSSCCVWIGQDPAGGAAHCWDDYCPSPTVGPQGWGNGRWLKQCGSDPTFHECRGQAVCQFSCGYNTVTSSQINTQIPGSVPCPGDDVQVPDNALPWSFVGNGTSGCSVPQNAVWCQTYCPSGWAFNSLSGACEQVVCGDGIKHPTLELCDPGGSNDQPLIQTWHSSSAGNGGSRLQKQSCQSNCSALGYRYWQRATNNLLRVNPPGYQQYYDVHGGNDRDLYVTCKPNPTTGKERVIRINETPPYEHQIGGGSDPNACEGGHMRCANQEWQFWWLGQELSHINSSEGSPFCLITCQGFSNNNDSTYGFICEDPPPLNCWVNAYHPATASQQRIDCHTGGIHPNGIGGSHNWEGSYQVWDYSEGGNPGRASQRLCCRNSSTPNLAGQCIAQSVPWAASYPSCPSGKTEWFRIEAQDGPTHSDSKTRFCCNNSISPSLPTCHAIYMGAWQPREFQLPVCPAGHRQIFGYCEGNCDNDDFFVRGCCTGF